jgi:transposase
MGRPSKLTIYQQEKAIDLYINKFLSTKKIAKLYGVTCETIRNVLIKYKIPRREGRETAMLSTKFSFKQMDENKAFFFRSNLWRWFYK